MALKIYAEMEAHFDMFQSNFGVTEDQFVAMGHGEGWGAVLKMRKYKPGTTSLFFSKYRACLVDHPFPKGMRLLVANEPAGVARLEVTAPKNSLFQVASNFHAFEQVAHDSSPQSKPLQDIFYDMTQGPAAVIPTSLDLITRRYLYRGGREEYTDAKLNEGRWPLDMLAKMHSRGVGITVGGWADITHAQDPQYANEAFDLVKCVGAVLVKDALVTHDDRGREIASRNQRVHQVLTSTLDITLFDSRVWMNIFLIAAYINTLTAASVLHVSNVYLTLIGGGVFANPIPCIFAAMAIAFNTVDFCESQRLPHFHVVMGPPKDPKSMEAHRCCSIVDGMLQNRLTLAQCLEQISSGLHQ